MMSMLSEGSSSAPASTTKHKLTLDLAQRLLAEKKGEIAEHERRALTCFVLREGDEMFIPPSFNFKEERAKADKARENKLRIESARSVANARNSLEFEGTRMTIEEALFRKSELASQKDWVKALHVVNSKSREHVRTGTTDVNGAHQYREVVITSRSVLTEGERTAEMDALQKRINALNLAINNANRRVQITVELLD